MKFQVVKEPGYLNDLLGIFSIWYNKEHFVTTCTNPEKKRNDIAYYQEMCDRFAPCPDELYPFFWLRGGRTSFMTDSFFGRKDVNVPFSMSLFTDALKDANKVADELAHFYFGTGTGRDDVAELAKMVSDLDCTDTVRHHLLTCLITPQKYVELLKEQLVAKEKMLKRLYNDQESTFKRLAKEMQPEELANFLAHGDNGITADQMYHFSVSFCLIQKNQITLHMGSSVVLLGFDYQDAMKAILAQSLTPDPAKFGKIMSEGNRIKILDMLNEQDDMCTAEIAKRLKTSVTVVYYHLEMMSEAQMLNYRNEGRTIFYRINRQYFDNIRRGLIPYCSPEK